MTAFLCSCVGSVGGAPGGEGGERQGRGRGEISQTDHHSIGTGQAGFGSREGRERERGERRDLEEGGGKEKEREGQEDKLGATFLSPLSCYVQDLEVKVQAVVEETKALKHSLQRLQQSSASREEVSKRLIVFKLSQLSK